MSNPSPRRLRNGKTISFEQLIARLEITNNTHFNSMDTIESIGNQQAQAPFTSFLSDARDSERK